MRQIDEYVAAFEMTDREKWAEHCINQNVATKDDYRVAAAMRRRKIDYLGQFKFDEKRARKDLRIAPQWRRDLVFVLRITMARALIPIFWLTLIVGGYYISK